MKKVTFGELMDELNRPPKSKSALETSKKNPNSKVDKTFVTATEVVSLLAEKDAQIAELTKRLERAKKTPPTITKAVKRKKQRISSGSDTSGTLQSAESDPTVEYVEELVEQPVITRKKHKRKRYTSNKNISSKTESKVRESTLDKSRRLYPLKGTPLPRTELKKIPQGKEKPACSPSTSNRIGQLELRMQQEQTIDAKQLRVILTPLKIPRLKSTLIESIPSIPSTSTGSTTHSTPSTPTSNPRKPTSSPNPKKSMLLKYTQSEKESAAKEKFNPTTEEVVKDLMAEMIDTIIAEEGKRAGDTTKSEQGSQQSIPTLVPLCNNALQADTPENVPNLQQTLLNPAAFVDICEQKMTEQDYEVPLPEQGDSKEDDPLTSINPTIMELLKDPVLDAIISDMLDHVDANVEDTLLQGPPIETLTSEELTEKDPVDKHERPGKGKGKIWEHILRDREMAMGYDADDNESDSSHSESESEVSSKSPSYEKIPTVDAETQTEEAEMQNYWLKIIQDLKRENDKLQEWKRQHDSCNPNEQSRKKLKSTGPTRPPIEVKRESKSTASTSLEKPSEAESRRRKSTSTSKPDKPKASTSRDMTDEDEVFEVPMIQIEGWGSVTEEQFAKIPKNFETGFVTLNGIKTKIFLQAFWGNFTAFAKSKTPSGHKRVRVCLKEGCEWINEDGHNASAHYAQYHKPLQSTFETCPWVLVKDDYFKDRSERWKKQYSQKRSKKMKETLKIKMEKTFEDEEES
uniref:Uncharacterized protein n=1 Tax=Tetranychus urticae TaxID=32264 RepID=T1KLY6_TETUR